MPASEMKPLSGDTEFDLFNSFQVDGLAGVPQFMIVLHRQPTPGRTPKGLGKAKQTRPDGVDCA